MAHSRKRSPKRRSHKKSRSPKRRSHKKSRSPKRRSHKKSRSGKRRSHKKSRKSRKSKSRSRKSRTYRLTKFQFGKLKLSECRQRKSADNCNSDPNCSWNSAGGYCYKGKQNIYQGPSMPIAF